MMSSTCSRTVALNKWLDDPGALRSM